MREGGWRACRARDLVTLASAIFRPFSLISNRLQYRATTLTLSPPTSHHVNRILRVEELVQRPSLPWVPEYLL